MTCTNKSVVLGWVISNHRDHDKMTVLISAQKSTVPQRILAILIGPNTLFLGEINQISVNARIYSEYVWLYLHWPNQIEYQQLIRLVQILSHWSVGRHENENLKRCFITGNSAVDARTNTMNLKDTITPKGLNTSSERFLSLRDLWLYNNFFMLQLINVHYLKNKNYLI